MVSKFMYIDAEFQIFNAIVGLGSFTFNKHCGAHAAAC